jgi:hypothetical protein
MFGIKLHSKIPFFPEKARRRMAIFLRTVSVSLSKETKVSSKSFKKAGHFLNQLLQISVFSAKLQNFLFDFYRLHALFFQKYSLAQAKPRDSTLIFCPLQGGGSNSA